MVVVVAVVGFRGRREEVEYERPAVTVERFDLCFFEGSIQPLTSRLNASEKSRESLEALDSLCLPRATRGCVIFESRKSN